MKAVPPRNTPRDNPPQPFLEVFWPDPDRVLEDKSLTWFLADQVIPCSAFPIPRPPVLPSEKVFGVGASHTEPFRRYDRRGRV